MDFCKMCLATKGVSDCGPVSVKIESKVDDTEDPQRDYNNEFNEVIEWRNWPQFTPSQAETAALESAHALYMVASCKAINFPELPPELPTIIFPPALISPAVSGAPPHPPRAFATRNAQEFVVLVMAGNNWLSTDQVSNLTHWLYGVSRVSDASTFVP